jgi:hypothetical protein
MAGEFFLWGGFVLGCLWHLMSWLWASIANGETTEANQLVLLNAGISGVTLCAFGYLLFA